MPLHRLLIAAVLALTHLGSALAEDKAPSLLVMGDSLSAAYGLKIEDGWVSLLARKLQTEGSHWRVVNASITGETTAGGVARIDQELKLHHPQWLIIELGTNDGLRGLPLELTRANLDRMIRAAKTAGAKVLLLGMRIPPNYGPEYTAAFQALYVDLAKRHSLTLLPFLLAPIATDRRHFLEDNLHPNAAAQPLLLAHVWSVLAPLLKSGTVGAHR